MDRRLLPRRCRILLTGVFGPFGVDDAYGRKENIMELFHNQVTKAQGEASFRFHHRSFGLYFLAANVDGDVTVLDFPSRERFVRELHRGWDVVGISFIAPNFVKAREMARLARIHAPLAHIVLGGHGAAIEGIEQLIDCDHVIRGEGIRVFRKFLRQDPDAPIVHPVLPSSERESILGVPLLGASASLLVPGVGCVNGCRFCCTSHFFGRAYTPYLATGRELFETACRIADARGTDEFFVMDENFLKDRARALELLDLMERHRRYFGFHIFSSAEAIAAFGLDNLVRLGVSFVWIGVESSTREGNYAKNDGVDARALVRALRDRGISVLASGILCDEHHTPDTIQAEIDFMVGLEADMVQFMLFTPLPVTALYRDMQRRGLLRTELPWEEWHGQKELAWRHPAFPGDAPQRWLDRAFRRDYEVNSSSILRVVETALRGYRRLAAMRDRDACLEHRLRTLRRRVREWSPILGELESHGVNQLERSRARTLSREVAAAIGGPGLRGRALRAAVRVFAAAWRARVRLAGDSIQPRTIVTRFPADRARACPVPVVPVLRRDPEPVPLSRAAAIAPAP
ncbi:MAG TPA: radical SAM protein [Thermoanaerobaculaceae bacterium]|nr:radical SAM protein [Thermoanaerobaculaceae bacterium]HRS16505.1 radical SAM protein [Thermoanaerobaculaceae bacterium]